VARFGGPAAPVVAGQVIWEPTAAGIASSPVSAYMRWLSERDVTVESYEQLRRWSVDRIEDFWASIWDYFEVIDHGEPGPVLADATMPGARWFVNARLNYAEHVLRHGGEEDIVLIAQSQTRAPAELSRRALRSEVARVRAGLLRLGVGRGDRVAGYLPNAPEAVIALLASASLGAIWAACPPEFGISSALDRLRQIDPKVLIAVDGYRYGTKAIDRTAEVAEIRAALPGLNATVSVPYLDSTPGPPPGAQEWEQLRAEEAPLEFEAVPFDHPLWILFSSGTTGLPKPIVHGHGGILLEHLKMGGLMHGMDRTDRFCFFSTTGWMVWNRVVSSLLVGAGIAILDGSPTFPEPDSLFGFVAETGTTVWGVSSAYLMLCREAGCRPGERYDLSRVREVVAAGSALPLEGYEYLEQNVEPGVLFYSGSGGTEVCSAFVSGTPITPVRAGEIPARMLGVAAEAFDPNGHAVIDEPGELVITKPMPSMPVCFWNDPGDRRYRAAFFERYPGIWLHGDRFLVNSHGGCQILGRSDAVLNRGGVRLGTSEFYGALEPLDAVADSLVVHLDAQDGAGGELLLFVVLSEGYQLDDQMRDALCAQLRRQRSPRHVPDQIVAVPAIPRTLTGKKLEVPVKQVLLGANPATVASAGSLEDPSALDAFAAYAAARARRVKAQ
jgi:acetoacetyl-CoA synthetase